MDAAVRKLVQDAIVATLLLLSACAPEEDASREALIDPTPAAAEVEVDADRAPPDIVITAIALAYESEPGAASSEALIAEASRHFLAATGGRIGLAIDRTVPLRLREHDVDSLLERYPSLHPDDLPRVWYGEASYRVLFEDITAALAGADIDTEPYDIVLVLTDVNLPPGLGFFVPNGILGMPTASVETWNLGAWGLGRDSYPSYAREDGIVADVVTHELGHFMGLDHACGQCLADGLLDGACCDSCPARDDVMSYCRERDRPRGEENLFETCNMTNLELNFVPAIGSASTIPKSPACG
jgi:hypothetical protein